MLQVQNLLQGILASNDICNGTLKARGKGRLLSVVLVVVWAYSNLVSIGVEAGILPGGGTWSKKYGKENIECNPQMAFFVAWLKILRVTVP